MSHACLYSQPQSIIKLWIVLIFCPAVTNHIQHQLKKDVVCPSEDLLHCESLTFKLLATVCHICFYDNNLSHADIISKHAWFRYIDSSTCSHQTSQIICQSHSTAYHHRYYTSHALLAHTTVSHTAQHTITDITRHTHCLHTQLSS